MFIYGMRLRPAGPGCQPKGFMRFKDCDKSKTGYWSYLWYDRELTDEEITKYSLDRLIQED